MNFAQRHITLSFFALALLYNTVSYAQEEIYLSDGQLDSLALCSATMPDDTSRLSVLYTICQYHYNVDSTEKYALQYLNLSIKLGSKIDLAQSYRFLAWSSFYKNDYKSSIDYHYKSLIIWDSLMNESKMSFHYVELAKIFVMTRQYNKADELFGKALKYYINTKDSTNVAEVYRNLGYMCIEFSLMETANDYFKKALEIDLSLNNLVNVGEDYYMIAYNICNNKLQINKEQLNYAISLMLKALDYQQDNPRAYLWTCMLLYMAYDMLLNKTENNIEFQQMLDSCQYYQNRCIQQIKKSGFVDNIIHIEIINAQYNITIGNYKEAQKNIKAIEKKINDNRDLEGEFLKELYEISLWYYESVGDYKSALDWQKKINAYDFSSKPNDFAIQLEQTNAQTKFDEMIRQREQEARENSIRYEESIKRRNIAVTFTLICLILVTLLAINVFRHLVQHRRTNKILLEQQNTILLKNEELNKQAEKISVQRDEIERQRNDLGKINERMTESIQYAKRIQTATVPGKGLLTQMFGETLVYWKPLDIVSGDFYWAAQKEQCRLIAVAGSSGHGVPGAFVSMLGISSLDDIVLITEMSKISASEILEKLKQKLAEALNQNTSIDETINGINISLCIINHENMTVQYAGANSPLVIIRNGKHIEYSGDKMTIGFHANKAGLVFTNNVIPIQKSDVLYMYTDGLLDQFGFDENGNKNRFGKKRFMKTLCDISTKPFNEQKEMMEKTFSDWTRNGEINQGEDQLLIGITF